MPSRVLRLCCVLETKNYITLQFSRGAAGALVGGARARRAPVRLDTPDGLEGTALESRVQARVRAEQHGARIQADRYMAAAMFWGSVAAAVSAAAAAFAVAAALSVADGLLQPNPPLAPASLYSAAAKPCATTTVSAALPTTVTAAPCVMKSPPAASSNTSVLFASE